MKLGELMDREARFEPPFGALDIKGVCADSRAVKPGFLFAAVPGNKADGLAYLPQALANGAVAVMAERAPSGPLPDGVAFVEVPNVRRALALVAAKVIERVAPLLGMEPRFDLPPADRLLLASIKESR